MKIALLSDANTPGPFKHHPFNWRINSVEALAWALDASVWHGQIINGVLLDHWAEYDLIIINLKHTLWRIIPDIAAAIGDRVIIAGFQEDAGDLAGTLDAPDLDNYLEALHAVRHLFVYDRRAIPWFRAIGKGNEAVSYLPLPAPIEVYDKIRIPYDKRPPDRVGLCQAISAQRGAYLSILLAAQCNARVLCHGKDAEEVGLTARLIAQAGAIPDCFSWLEWNRSTFNDEHSFLRRFAQCRLAVNLDNRACYGRFLVDCAGLGIPCICSRESAVAQDLFPDLTFDGYRDFDRARRAARRLLSNPTYAQRIADKSLAALRSKYSLTRIRRLFNAAMAKEPQCVSSS